MNDLELKIARLREERNEAELSRLRKQRDYDVWNERILRRAAEARCAQLEAEALAFDNVRAAYDDLIEERDAAQRECARLQQALADANEARRGIIAACIAVKGKLDAPYPDDNRWTPWQRFIEPALRRLDEALAGPGTPEARVEAELARLRVKCAFPSCVDGDKPEWCGRCGDASRAEAAEARCARLQQALTGLESAVRILDVMLREPAAEGLMSAEDYRSYVQGAWLGVDEAAEKARDALAGPDAHDPSAGERQGRQPDPGEIAGLLVELSRWSRVAELNGDLHARIASALAGAGSEQSSLTESGLAGLPDTPTLPYVFDKSLKRWGLFLGDLPNADWIEYVRHLESLAGPDAPAEEEA